MQRDQFPLPDLRMPQVLLREWGNDLGFTQLPKFTSRESLTPVPTTTCTLDLQDVISLLNRDNHRSLQCAHPSVMCSNRVLPTSCVCFLIRNSLRFGRFTRVRLVGRFGAREPHIPQHLYNSIKIPPV